VCGGVVAAIFAVSSIAIMLPCTRYEVLGREDVVREISGHA
jgi:hypothetical protein